MPTMNVSLPDEMRTFVEEQDGEGRYGSSSEYIRALIRRDQERHPLRNLLLTGAASDPGPVADDAYVAVLARQHVGPHPHSGSLRCSYDLDLPELRAWPLTGFPYLVFYVERDSGIDVWRILHTRRDIPSALADNDEK